MTAAELIVEQSLDEAARLTLGELQHVLALSQKLTPVQIAKKLSKTYPSITPRKVRYALKKVHRYNKSMEAPKEGAQAVIESVLVSEQVHDLALDFVENGLGRYRFPDNWIGLGPARIERVRQWLESVDTEASPAEIATILDGMAEEGVQWTTPLIFKTKKLPKS